MPGVIAGALMAFTLSIDDFVITFFTAGVGVSTLPLQIYSMIKIAVTPEVNAISTLLMAADAGDDRRRRRGSRPTLLARTEAERMQEACTGACCALTDLAAGEPRRTELHLYNWNNYIAPETVKRFEELCKCELVQTYYSDNEELLAKLAAGATGYDVLVPTGNAVEALIKGGQLMPIDKSQAAEPQEHQARLSRHAVRSGQQVLGALRDVDDDHRLQRRRR